MPCVANVATVAMLVPMKQNVPTAPVAMQPSASSAQSGYWKKIVQRIKAEQGITFMEAHRIAVAESEGRTVQGRRTAAAVVASINSSTLGTGQRAVMLCGWGGNCRPGRK